MAYLLVFLPLVASFIVGIFGRILGDKISQFITCSFVLISSVLSIYIFSDVAINSNIYNLKIFNWITSGGLVLNWSINIDTLTSVMLVVVTSVSALVHVYSVGYMSHDPDKPRFMSYLSLFTFMMLMLVTSDNFLQLFFGWEGVGLASYLLIGFWYKKPSANSAAIKAFVVNRVGDFGLAIGIFLIFKYTGSVNFVDVFKAIPTLLDKNISMLGIESSLINFICIFLFIGAMGKSAQIFLHTWLPDAMEGPTPVSALIHAATMVTAGVFLVVRCSPIFEYSPFVLNIIVLVGATTAFFAGTIGLVQNDIKRVIAYSTCSQLGYMFFAAGLGAYHIAIFHLFTHAFFKALLFLGAGSVIHAFNDEQDMRNMGGVWKKIPYTYSLMIIGTLALTGFPFLSGFFSKDAIIETAYNSTSFFAGYAVTIGVLTAFMTSLYSWRLIFMTFHGTYNNKNISLSKVHESPAVMLVPLLFLALGAIFAGYAFKDYFIGSQFIQFWSSSIFFLKEFVLLHPPLWFLLLTPILVLLAIPLSYYFFVKDKKSLDGFVEINKPLYNFLVNKWYFDELYDFLFVKPAKKIGAFFWKIGDGTIIDGFGPDGLAKLVKLVSDKAVQFQSGFLYHYAFVILIGLSILLTYMMIF
ncbi:NADH-ubiquinone oxidoreductase chain L [Candidatus Pelagibacter sp. IMCC9063]|uniref:NADH-quinone oxidoreductase subunit L n=1 Tax=Pelagibacter sp. (strain IMCC9063) TaxID=1002672 RepID=UPI000204676B|nr:NADH-quinone oxidoreductase subunit L [Candidatus Pelagibacter sp. IMCC9063]AEA81493.1 NADH-ubiquinone oxidoreductase chain L [Candidatus Pelagibacter sp. IMCC9063]